MDSVIGEEEVLEDGDGGVGEGFEVEDGVVFGCWFYGGKGVGWLCLVEVVVSSGLVCLR